MSNVLKINNFLAVLILLVMATLSCESEKKQSKNQELINIDYFIRYLKSDKQVKAEISFSKVDTINKTVPKMMEEVLFQNKALDGKKVLNNYRYQTTAHTDFTENFNFEYRIEEQLIKLPTITMPTIENFSLKKGKLSKAIGSSLSIEGAPLQANEQIILLLSDSSNKATTLSVDGPLVDLEIKISPEQIDKLKVGKGSIYIVRKQVIQSITDHANITGLTEYYSEVKEIEIIE